MFADRLRTTCHQEAELSSVVGAGNEFLGDRATGENGSRYGRRTAMSWLNSNWIWLAFGAVALLAFSRVGCGMGHSGHDRRNRAERDQFGRPHDPTASPLSIPIAGLGSQAGTPSSTGHVHDAPSENQGTLITEPAGHDSGPGHAGGQRHHHKC